VAQRLRELAGLRLYRANAFRVVGLPPEADRRTVRQTRRRLAAVLAVGGTLPTGVTAGREEIRAALDRLDDPGRLVDELFAVWGNPRGCGCPGAVHDLHDRAVSAHAAALDAETGAALHTSAPAPVETLWAEAVREWTALLQGEGLWAHVRHRAAATDDDRVDEAVVDRLREGLPLTLVAGTIDLAVAADDPARLVACARSWPVPADVVDERLADAAAPLIAEVEDLVGRARAAVAAEDGGPRYEERLTAAAAALDDRAGPALRRLDALLPSATHRSTAVLHDGAAAQLDTCAGALWVRTGTLTADLQRDWLRAARELALSDGIRRQVADDRETLERLVAQMDQAAPPPRSPHPARRTAWRRWAVVAVVAGAAAGLFWAGATWWEPVEPIVVEPASSFSEAAAATYVTKCFRGAFPRDEETDEKAADIRAVSCSEPHDAELVGGGLVELTIVQGPPRSRADSVEYCAQYSHDLPRDAIRVTVIPDSGTDDVLCLAVRADGAPFPAGNGS